MSLYNVDIDKFFFGIITFKIHTKNTEIYGRHIVLKI